MISYLIYYIFTENFEKKDAKLPVLNKQNEFDVNLQRIQSDLYMTHMICASDKRVGSTYLFIRQCMSAGY